MLAFAFQVSAQQRPLLTDDIDITPAGSLEISAGVDFYQDARFPLAGMEGDLTRVGDIRIKTGIASNVELQIEGVLQNYVSIEHILHAIAFEEDDLFSSTMRDLSVDPRSVKMLIEKRME
ncbi:MAG: hypothetical protein DYH05_14810, partial [Acidobacteria bacterium ACB1]|nr:hypothetical protein [Acidobacteria bacterium ACB1]